MPKGEISTDTIVRNALQKGKKVFIPYVHKVAQATSETPVSVMDMVMLQSLEDYETLEPDSWGIPTPSKASIGNRQHCLGEAKVKSRTNEQTTEGNIEMVIMPGMAFDTGFGRLGHGKGYYDFFLKRYQEKQVNDRNGRLMPFLGKSSSFLRPLHIVVCLT